MAKQKSIELKNEVINLLPLQTSLNKRVNIAIKRYIEILEDNKKSFIDLDISLDEMRIIDELLKDIDLNSLPANKAKILLLSMFNHDDKIINELKSKIEKMTMVHFYILTDTLNEMNILSEFNNNENNII